MLDRKQLGKRIALLRKQNGLSQEKLAELLCISAQAISKLDLHARKIVDYIIQGNFLFRNCRMCLSR